MTELNFYSEGAGEMASCFKSLGPQMTLFLFPDTTWWRTTHSNSSTRGDTTLFLTSKSSWHTQEQQTYMQAKYFSI